MSARIAREAPGTLMLAFFRNRRPLRWRSDRSLTSGEVSTFVLPLPTAEAASLEDPGWGAETDQQKLLHVTAIGPETRQEIDRYLRKSPRLGDASLFPAEENHQEAIRRDVAARWLLKAKKLAKLPKINGGVFHPYRRLWATERQHMSDVAVAAAGGWSDTEALRASYQQATKADI